MRKVFGLFLLPVILYDASADTVTLKSGEKVDGKVVQETATAVTVEVQVSPSITDQRVIHRDEIANIAKAQPDEIAFADLKGLKPNPQSSYGLGTYDRILTTLQAFQTNFPQSSHHAEVQTEIDAFEAEKTHAVAGEVKYLGRWITKDQAELRKIQIQAQELYGTMAQQAASGDVIGALNTFDQIEKSYATTRVYPDAVVFASQLLASLAKGLTGAAQTQAYDLNQFKDVLALTSEPKKSELIESAKREQAGYDAAVLAAQKTGAKWTPFIARSSTSVIALQKIVPSEAQRLANVPVAKMRESIAKVDSGRTALDAKNYSAAEASFKDALTLWPQNEAAIFWSGRLKQQQATPTPTPKAVTTPGPSPTPRHVSSPAPQAAASPAPVEEHSFFMTIPGAATIVVAVGLVIAVGTFISRKQMRKETSA